MIRTLHACAVGALLLAPGALVAQARSLSLEEALRLGAAQSEAVRIARAGVMRADGQQLQARSQYLPQLAGSVGYTRTLATQFSALQGGPAPVPPPGTPPAPPRDTSTYYTPCLRYLAPAGASDAERVRGLEAYARCVAGSGSFIDFERVGFGSRNQYSLGLQGTMTVFSGGRVQAQNRAALAGRRSAEIELASQQAVVALDVTEAYYDAALADRLVAIAESSLAQTEGALRQTRLARQVGNQSEFDLLRAQVTRDNQMPGLLQRRTDRDLAYLRLKQLLNLPYADEVRLTTAIDDERVPMVVAAASPTPDTSAASRATVRQLEEGVTAQEANLAIARSQWIPTVSLTSQYAKLNFPRNPAPGTANWLTNWSVGVAASFPIYTGGAIRGGRLIAQAGVDEAKGRMEQTRELASLEARQVIAQLEQAEAAVAASRGTSEQASRAYRIAEVRYSEGISTQLELSESRLLLEQASANRALAARNLQVARMRLALLKDLPLGSAGMPGTAAGGVGGAQAAPGSGASGGAPGGGAGAPSRIPRTTTTAATSASIPQNQ